MPCKPGWGMAAHEFITSQRYRHDLAATRSRMIERLREQGIRDEVVLAAMNSVPRHMFVEEAISHLAYDDKSLPIGYAQTISQPYIVARMIEVLRDGKQLNRVLEIGTGCGYQAAVLAQVAREVYSVERICRYMSVPCLPSRNCMCIT